MEALINIGMCFAILFFCIQHSALMIIWINIWWNCLSVYDACIQLCFVLFSLFFTHSSCIKYNEKIRFDELTCSSSSFSSSFFFLNRAAPINTHAHSSVLTAADLFFPLADISRLPPCFLLLLLLLFPFVNKGISFPNTKQLSSVFSLSFSISFFKSQVGVSLAVQVEMAFSTIKSHKKMANSHDWTASARLV